MQKSIIILLVFVLILQTSVSTIKLRGIEQHLDKVNVLGFLEGMFEGLKSTYPGLQTCLNEVVVEGSKLLPDIKKFIILLFKPISPEDIQALENVGYGVEALQAVIGECKSADQSEINQIKEFLESLKNPIEVVYKAGKELFIYQNSFAHFGWAGLRSAESGDLKGVGLQIGMILNQLFLNQTSIGQLQNQMNQFISQSQVQQDFKQSAQEFLEGFLQGLSTNSEANTMIEVFPCILTETVAQLQNIFYEFQQQYINTTTYHQVPKVAKSSIVAVGEALETLPDEMLSCGIDPLQVEAVGNFVELIKLGQYHKVLFNNLKNNGGKAFKLQLRVIQKLVHRDMKGFGQTYGQLIALIWLENEQISIQQPKLDLKQSLEKDIKSTGQKIEISLKDKIDQIENKIIKKTAEIMDEKNTYVHGVFVGLSDSDQLQQIFNNLPCVLSQSMNSQNDAMSEISEAIKDKQLLKIVPSIINFVKASLKDYAGLGAEFQKCGLDQENLQVLDTYLNFYKNPVSIAKLVGSNLGQNKMELLNLAQKIMECYGQKNYQELGTHLTVFLVNIFVGQASINE